MTLENLVATAKAQGASDLHLEPGLPPAFRINGVLKVQDDPVPAKNLIEAARELIGEAHWPAFLERRSFDMSRAIAGVRCRINVLNSTRGIGFAIRLLASFAATLERLNLHPDLEKFARLQHGLVLVCGPTGCGKSTTLAAFIQEINLAEARHIVTVESPIEYTFRPRRSFIRQREVGRDTPSFEQALLDSLREDPDVLMVGEMREPATMRLTLNASETGHLVFATMHSSTAAEALQRIVSAFAPESQGSVRAALADCIQAVVCQRLRYRPDLKLRIPECEILVGTHAVKNFIRQGEFFKIFPMIETGADHGMWTFDRYQRWLDKRKDWSLANTAETADADAEPAMIPSPLPPAAPGQDGRPHETPLTTPPGPVPGPRSKRTIEIEPVAGGLAEVVKKLAK
ncbi:MAG TPA: PilT/PilU family type 4a pilus ATPase [Candidatus Paceibacterota bacterium]|nr:PilT/PilU family type 4a pilus ATPase [Candidatus Paceibacterota bacterium]HRZ56587.1 PilT/PilU family type 4a pilus ATPase [Candidatus Paceibacterota bacterium]